MSPHACQVCESFDAAVFAGDEFQSPADAREALGYIESWKRELESRANSIPPEAA